MTTLTEGRHAAEFILSEANGHRSRENVTILGGSAGTGTTLAAGTVLGKFTSSGKYAIADASGSDGVQTAVAVLIAPIDIEDADVEAAVIARDAEVNGELLTYDASVDDATKIAAKVTQLAAVGIIVR